MKYLVHRLETIVFLFFSLFLISGCGRSYLESGDLKTDQTVLSEGCFSEVKIDTSFIPDNYSVYSTYSGNDHYSFLLMPGSSISARSTPTLYYVSCSKSGSLNAGIELDFPIYSENGNVYFHENCSEIAGYYNSLSGDFSATASYPGFTFDKEGILSAVCVLDIIIYSDVMNTDTLIRDLYLVKWDATGNLMSVESTDELPDYDLSFDKLVIGSDGRPYKVTSTGIAVLDNENNYSGKYFDFLNSNILSQGVVSAAVIDGDHFACVYKDSQGDTKLSCFIRKGNANTDKNALILACSGLDYDLISDVYSYNSDNSKYRITVYDYSDRALSSSEEEGWSLLKQDIKSGFKPDMIYNSTGYDSIFIDSLSSQGLLADFSKALSKDKGFKEFSFSDKAGRLFYNSENIYAIVPSYYYRTVVGSETSFASYEGWNLNSYLDFAEPFSGEKVIFLSDTSESFISRLIESTGNELVDYSSGSALFDSDEFISALNYAATLPKDFDEASELMYSETNLGKFMLSCVDCYYLGDLNLKATTTCRGVYADLGYPGAYSSGSGIISATGSFMISSEHAYSNECWNFIKKYLGDAYQTESVVGIPVSALGYDHWTGVREPHPSNMFELSYVVDGIEYSVSDPDDIQASLILERINSCDRFLFNDFTVKQIVLKYSTEFFDGEISAEEAAKQIDAEVESYLAA